jgi:LPXTG-motif cell wall-anchored protein
MVMPLWVIREAEQWTPFSVIGGVLLLAAVIGLVYYRARRR